MPQGAESGGRRRRVLQWLFVKGDETMTCQLALDAEALIYEFRTCRGDAPASTTVERFVEVSRAFERQCECEAGLIADGWTLQAYRSAVDDCAA